MAQSPLQRRPREVIGGFLYRQLRLTLPLHHRVLMLLAFLVQHMLIRNGNRHLRLHLHQLVLHIEHQLLKQLLRILRLLDQVIQIRT